MTGKLVFFLILGVIILYGSLVVFLTLRQKTKGRLKAFLLLSGFSALALPVFSVLHNLFYALEIITINYPLLSNLLGLLHGLSFLIAVILAPLGFLIGTISSLFMLVKKG